MRHPSAERSSLRWAIRSPDEPRRYEQRPKFFAVRFPTDAAPSGRAETLTERHETAAAVAARQLEDDVFDAFALEPLEEFGDTGERLARLRPPTRTEVTQKRRDREPGLRQKAREDKFVLGHICSNPSR